jgi:ketosteroid isomerase-like protein
MGIAAVATTAAPQPDEEAVRAARARQNRAIAEARIDEIASFWTDDVTICRGLGAQTAGKAAYRKLFEDDASTPERLVFVREPSSIDVSPRWPLAFETGNWSGRRGGVDGPVVISGRYSAHWVKRGEHWLIRAEVFVALEADDAARDIKAVP